MPDLTPETLAELRRRHAALTPFALSFLTGGPGGDPYIALAAEDGSQLTDAGFDAVLLFAEMASDSLPALLDAAAERDALAGAVERVRVLHRAVGIYDECDCDAPDPATHLDVDDVGLTCNLMYRVCAECCRDDVYQTEDCANYHAHRLDEDYHCPTIRALDEEPQPS